MTSKKLAVRMRIAQLARNVDLSNEMRSQKNKLTIAGQRLASRAAHDQRTQSTYCRRSKITKPQKDFAHSYGISLIIFLVKHVMVISPVICGAKATALSVRSTLLGEAGWHRADFAEARTLDDGPNL